MAYAKEIMIRKVITVGNNVGMQEIGNILIKNKVSGVPVVDKNKNLVGFISERDIIAAVAKPGFSKKKVEDVMTKKVISINEDARMDEISKLFTEKPIRCLPVLDEEKLVGVVLRKAVINKLLGDYY